jgi:hypothetical protein
MLVRTIDFGQASFVAAVVCMPGVRKRKTAGVTKNAATTDATARHFSHKSL